MNTRVTRLAANLFCLRGRVMRPVWALITLVLFLGLQAFAGSEALHKAIHSDAHLATHQCVITLISHGQIDAPVPAGAAIGICAAFLFFLPLFNAAALSCFDYRLSPSRAPPRF